VTALAFPNLRPDHRAATRPALTVVALFAFPTVDRLLQSPDLLSTPDKYTLQLGLFNFSPSTPSTGRLHGRLDVVLAVAILFFLAQRTSSRHLLHRLRG